MAVEPNADGTPDQQHPVKIKQLRFVYRDLIAASAAGEGIYKVLAGIAPLLRVDLFTIAWTGNERAPIALRREASYGREFPDEEKLYADARWYTFAKESRMARIVELESRAYYPDATRCYSSIQEFGHQCFKLVIGNHMIGIVFDRRDPLARLDLQVFSFLDAISQAVLDFNRRQLRHFMDQYVMAEVAEDSEYHANDIDRQVAGFIEGDSPDEEVATLLLRRNADILENFFGFVYVEYLMSPDIASVLFYRSNLESCLFEEHLYKVVRIPVDDYDGPVEPDPEAKLHILEFPLGWGLSNDENQFCMRLASRAEINPHVRRELLLNQALLKGKTELEALFDRRYRELRIAQDVAHFRRCRSVRTEQRSIDQIRDHLHNSVPDYGVLGRQLDHDLVFPEFDDWREGLARIFKDLNTDPLEFQPHIRMSDIRDYRHLPIRSPESLRHMLMDALHPEVYLKVRSTFPPLERLSDPGVNGLPADNFVEKVVFFNDAATVSVLYPSSLSFPFQRIKEMFDEYLESVGEGIGHLFTLVNPNSGISNRSSLMQRLEFLVAQTQYSDLVTLELSSLDIVSFKIFNELFGHPFGDRVIQFVAHQMDSCLPSTAFHVSGDEYYAVYCWHRRTGNAWVEDFFHERSIYPEDDAKAGRKRLDAFAKGVPVCVPLSDVNPVGEGNFPVGTYQLCQLVANFFTKDAEGSVNYKKYSRSGNDYHTVIWDPQRRLQILVDETYEALMDGKIALDDDSFRSFVLNQSSVGDKLFILPRLTIGSVSFNIHNIMAYPSDLIEAAEAAAGRHKK